MKKRLLSILLCTALMISSMLTILPITAFAEDLLTGFKVVFKNASGNTVNSAKPGEKLTAEVYLPEGNYTSAAVTLVPNDNVEFSNIVGAEGIDYVALNIIAQNGRAQAKFSNDGGISIGKAPYFKVDVTVPSTAEVGSPMVLFITLSGSNAITGGKTYTIPTDGWGLMIPKCYDITDKTAQDAHGSISFDKTTAAEKDTVIVTVTPAEGYQLKSLNYVHKLSDWSVTGNFANNWNDDIWMAETETGVFVSPVITLSEGDEFKVRKNADWAENFGATDEANVTLDTPVAVSQDGMNMVIPSAGNYTVILNLNDNTITVTSASASVADSVAITADGQGNYTFTMPAYNVTVTATFEEKIVIPPVTEIELTFKDLTRDDLAALPADLVSIKSITEGNDDMLGEVQNYYCFDKDEKFLFMYGQDRSGWAWADSTGSVLPATPENLDDVVYVVANALCHCNFSERDDIFASVITVKVNGKELGVLPNQNDCAEGYRNFSNCLFVSIKYDLSAHTHKGVKQNGQAATEEAAGWKDYYKCDCGQYFEDETCTTLIGDEAALATWKTGKGAIQKLPHSHKGTKQNGQAATEDAAGFHEYFYCEGCDTYFEDENCTKTIGDAAALTTWKSEGTGYIAPTGGGNDPKDPDPKDDDIDKGGLSTGAIVGIVIGAVAVVAAAAFCVWFFLIKKKKDGGEPTDGGNNDGNTPDGGNE